MDIMDPPPQKLRIMCSHGGHIVPVPNKLKSLFYVGGETRIISLPASSTATFSAFSSHIAASLQVGYAFALKYQLPLHDLDSLVSISTDEDLMIFLEELHRLTSSPAPARIRLFLIPVKQHELGLSGAEVTQAAPTQPGLNHPKTESWFVDALKSAKMMQQKGEMGGYCGEGGQSEGLSGQESMMLETTSSFGSSSSSVSLSNLPPIKACGDENVTYFQDSKITLSSTESAASDIGGSMYAQTVTYQDPNLSVAAMENTKIPHHIQGLPVHKTVQVAGHPLSTQLDQLQQPQHLQYVQMGNPTSMLPAACYYSTYSTLSPHQPLQYFSNQSYPVYVVPIGQPQAYNASPQYCSKEIMPVVSGRPPLHPNTSQISPQVAYKEVTEVPPIPGFVSQVYRTTPLADSTVHVPYTENKQQDAVFPHICNQPLPPGVTSTETANYSSEQDDDVERAQIYKSQPPPPSLPSQYQTMSNAATVLLSEALAQLHMDNIKQHTNSSKP